MEDNIMNDIYKILNSFNKVAQEPAKAEPQPKAKTQLQESMEQVLAKKLDETKADYSAKNARAGQDIGKPGKQFAKIAKGAAERYGSKERGEKVAGAVLKKLRAKEGVAEGLDEASVYKKDQDLNSIPTKELVAFVNKHWGGGVPTLGQGESVKRAVRELRRRQKQGVAEGNDGNLANNAKPYDKVTRGDVVAGRLGKDEMGGKDKKKDKKKVGEALTSLQTMNEQQLNEAIMEVLGKDASAGEWISDFIHSKNPKFKGKSKEERKRMALGAYYSAHPEKSKKEGIEEETRVHKGKYGTDYQGDDDEDDKDKKKEPQAKRGRGRPKLGADNTGVVKKYSGDALSKAMGGGEKPKHKAKASAVHKMKESVSAKIDKMVTEAMDPNIEAQGLNYEQNQLKKALGDELFNELQATLESDGELSDTLMDAVMEYYMNSGDMPYGTMKARDGDPYDWIANKLSEVFPYSGDKSPNDYMDEDDMEEGNAFSGAVAKAKADGIHPGEKITVGGKEYPVKEEQAELEEMKRLAGLQECGEMSPISGQQAEQPGRMDVTTTMSSDGNKTISISATGNAADELMQVLTLSGMQASSTQMQQPMEEEKDPRYEASTTPDETVLPIQVQTKGGDGDVAGEEKDMDPDGSARFSDNPMAVKKVKESKDEIDSLENMGLNLLQDYNSIKKVVKK